MAFDFATFLCMLTNGSCNALTLVNFFMRTSSNPSKLLTFCKGRGLMKSVECFSLVDTSIENSVLSSLFLASLVSGE